jgi:hypothetical protein
MRTLGLRQRLEPVRDLAESLVAGSLRHARVHVRVLVRLAGDRRLQVVRGRADRQSGRRIADLFEIFEVAVRMPGLALRSRAEHGRDVVVTLDVRLLGEIEVATIGLRLAGESGLQIALGLAALQVHGALLVWVGRCGQWFRQILTPRMPGERGDGRGRGTAPSLTTSAAAVKLPAPPAHPGNRRDATETGHP